MEINRRHFLKQAGTAISFGFLTSSVSRAFSLPQNSFDVAIIGGGLAGLTFAHKIKQSNLKACIFEAHSTRLGGRVKTLYNFNSDRQSVELGGEHINLDHYNLLNLCAEFGIETIKVDSPLAAEKNMDIFYAQNKLIRQDELNLVSALLLKFINNDLINMPKDNEGNILWPDYLSQHSMWKKFDNMSISEYLDQYRNDLPNWYTTLIENGMSTLNGNDASLQSCISLMQVFPTEINPNKFSIWQLCDESLKIKGGNYQLIKKLNESISNNIQVSYQHKLLKIKDKLSYFLLTFQTNTGIKEIKANRVVFAMPSKMLPHVEGLESLDLSPVKKLAIKNYGFGKNSKTILGFKERIWKEESNPIQLHKRLGSDCIGGAFWESTKLQKGKRGALTYLVGGSLADKIEKNNHQGLLKFYSKLWPEIQNYYDKKRVSIHWGKDPNIRGSYSSPLVGQYTSIYGCWEEGELNNRLHFIGEHVSKDYYGYMEGACQSAVQLAEKFSNN